MAYSAQRAAYYNPYIANELYKNDGRCANDTAYTRAQAQMFRRKPKSDETKAREAAERRTNSRGNICGECHMTKATGTGTCGC